MGRIAIVGCGQHANVILYNLNAQAKYSVLGFFDSSDEKLGQQYCGFRVLENYTKSDLRQLIDKYETDKFFIGFGNMKYRKRVYEKFVSCGWQAVNIIHPQAVVSPNAKLGRGILIEAGCLVTPNPIIGNNVVINTGSQVNHDNVVEDHVYIASGVVLSGGVTIRENSLLDDGVIVTLGKQVGSNCIVGAGGVVTKDLDDNVVAYGVPAKVIRQNTVI